MGFWSKVKKAITVAVEVAPVLPIPEKAKRIVSKVGHAESDVEAIVEDVKPKKKPKPSGIK